MFKKTITYSLGLGIIISGLFIIQYLQNIHTENNFTYGLISLAFIILFIFIGIKNNATENFQLKDGLKTGIAIAVISGLIYWVYQFIHASFIEPDFANKILEIKASEHLSNFPKTSPDDITKMKQDFLENFHFNNFVGVMIPSLFTGFVTAMISSAILKYSIYKKS